MHVYERTAAPGGKARSVGRPGTGKKEDLPGEHGFRFFPRFYRHVTDTIMRIPFRAGGSVADNLVKATEHAIALSQGEPFTFPLRFPWRPKDWRVYLDFARRFDELGLNKDDLEFFGWRVWQLLTMCEQRTADEYERVCWWEFLEADHRGHVFQDFLAAGLTRTLIAAQPRTASTQVGGRIAGRAHLRHMYPGQCRRPATNGPTNETWLDPWQAHLVGQGVKFHFNSPTQGFRCEKGKIAGVIVHIDGRDIEITANSYVAALPVEVMGPMVNAEMVRADETLLGIRELATQVGWMTGAQFHLDREAPVAHGHVTYIESPWALTSNSQKQFWTVDLATYGPGTVKDVLSVDVSNWFTQDKDGRPQTRKCTTEQEVLDEVWCQVKDHLGSPNVARLHSRLDPEITFNKGIPSNRRRCS